MSDLRQNPDQEIECRLRQMLTRVEPPAGFAERVAARATQRSHRESWFMWQRGWALAVAVLCLASAVFLAGYIHHRRVERQRQVALATQQLRDALAFADVSVQTATTRAMTRALTHLPNLASRSKNSHD